MLKNFKKPKVSGQAINVEPRSIEHKDRLEIKNLKKSENVRDFKHEREEGLF